MSLQPLDRLSTPDPLGGRCPKGEHLAATSPSSEVQNRIDLDWQILSFFGGILPMGNMGILTFHIGFYNLLPLLLLL